MPRVVHDQKTKYEGDELFKKLCQEHDIRYTAVRDKSIEERRERFTEDVKQGHTQITFVSTGTNISLQFVARGLYGDKLQSAPSKEQVDFDRESGKVHLAASLILNGVCVKFVGWIDMDTLNGKAQLLFDEERAKKEDKLMKESIELAQEKQRQFDERLWKEQQTRKMNEGALAQSGTS